MFKAAHEKEVKNKRQIFYTRSGCHRGSTLGLKWVWFDQLRDIRIHLFHKIGGGAGPLLDSTNIPSHDPLKATPRHLYVSFHLNINFWDPLSCVLGLCFLSSGIPGNTIQCGSFSQSPSIIEIFGERLSRVIHDLFAHRMIIGSVLIWAQFSYVYLWEI